MHVALSISMSHSSFWIESNERLRKFTWGRRGNKEDILSIFGKRKKESNIFCDKELKMFCAGKARQLAQNSNKRLNFMDCIAALLSSCRIRFTHQM